MEHLVLLCNDINGLEISGLMEDISGKYNIHTYNYKNL